MPRLGNAARNIPLLVAHFGADRARRRPRRFTPAECSGALATAAWPGTCAPVCTTWCARTSRCRMAPSLPQTACRILVATPRAVPVVLTNPLDEFHATYCRSYCISPAGTSSRAQRLASAKPHRLLTSGCRSPISCPLISKRVLRPGFAGRALSFIVELATLQRRAPFALVYFRREWARQGFSAAALSRLGKIPGAVVQVRRSTFCKCRGTGE